MSKANFFSFFSFDSFKKKKKTDENTNTKQYISMDSHKKNSWFWIKENLGTFPCFKIKRPVEMIDFRANTLGCNVNGIYICFFLYVDIRWVFPKGRRFTCTLYSFTPENDFC